MLSQKSPVVLIKWSGMKTNRIYLILFIVFLSVNSSSAVNMTERTTNCEKILDYEGITTIVGSLMLMILGFSIILHSLKVENPSLILLGIITTIIGFGTLIMGNYLFAIIFNALC